MSSHPPPPAPPSPPPSTSGGGGVRRHHTISASSRAARAGAREAISEETQEQQLWNDDEVVDQDWVGGVGAVGEKSSLHRQSSLPTRYHRGECLKGPSVTILAPRSLIVGAISRCRLGRAVLILILIFRIPRSSIKNGKPHSEDCK